ncbi:EF-hand domain-containing protein [Dongia sp.]|uniref:EF-hand domain-containing protein n=1 Tax=Dongia sp. TaxID=1977262 RepID=UPI0035B4E3EE
MKNSNRLMLLGGVIGLMLSAAVPAVAEMGPWPNADTNNDGAIDRAEFDAQRKTHFTSVDSNGDGFATEAEFKTFFDAQHAKMEGKQGEMGAMFLKHFDQNNDGKVTEAEWPKKGRMTFAEMDANKDGVVTADELGKMRKPHDGKGGPDGKDHMARLDTDKDGKVSAAEWSTQAEKIFVRLDDNKDGKIAKDEMPRHHKRYAPSGEGPVLP